MNRQLETEALLPFWVNETLDDADKTRVQQALAANPDLQVEVDVLRRLREDMKSQPLPQSPGEFGLARLNRTLDQQRGQTRRAAWVLPLTLAAGICLAAVGLSVLAPKPAGPEFVQASGEGAEAVFVVSLAQTATVAQMAQLLDDNDLLIIDGPSALGLYRLAILGDSDPGPILETLLAAGDIVTSAERLDE